MAGTPAIVTVELTMPLRVLTLGGLRLIRRGEEVASVGQSPLRAALLAVLGVEREVPRERLLALFWPESAEDRARHSLNQALYQLRQSFGADVVSLKGERVAAGAIEIDALDLERAVESNDHAAALDLYSGRFLEGVDRLPSCNALEQWVDGRRAHYERLHRRARRAHISAALERGDVTAALRSAREWVRIDPGEDEARHRLIELLALEGHVVDALREYETYERLLAADDLEPLEETRKLAAELRERSLQQRLQAPALAPSEPAREAAHEPGTGSLRRSVLAGVLIVALLAVITISWKIDSGGQAGQSAQSENRIVVLPFRVTGTDSALAGLGEGMVDLITMELSATDGPEAVDPHTTFSAIREMGAPHPELARGEALGVARKLGAAHLLVGSLVVTPAQLTISAELINTQSGQLRGRGVVQGPLDSLSVLIGRLTAQIAGVDLGETDERLNAFLSASPAAVRSYLRGRYLFRRGRFSESSVHFAQALDHDSTFGLAATYWVRAGEIAPAAALDGVQVDRLRRLACDARNRLSQWERTRVVAFMECPDVVQPGVAVVRFIEQGLRVAPGDPELWWRLGDLLFHDGVGYDGGKARAKDAMARAVRLGLPDSLEALAHLLITEAEARNPAGVEHYAERVARLDHGRFYDGHWLWLRPVMAGDSPTLRRLRSNEFEEVRSKWQIVRYANALGLSTIDAEIALRAMKRQVGLSAIDQRFVRNAEALHALNGGQPSRALGTGAASDVELIVDALFWDGDRQAAERAAHRLAQGRAERPSTERNLQLCTLGLWRIMAGQQIAPDLLQADQGRCGAMLIALHEVQRKSPSRQAALERLDSIQRFEPWDEHAFDRWPHAADLLAARLFEREGQPRRALTALQRRTAATFPVMVSSRVREEGRLAAQMGDTVAAQLAYKHYIALRQHAEPSLLREVERVRQELKRLAAR